MPVGFDGIARLLNILGVVNAGFVLLVGYTRDKDSGGFVVGIEIQRALGMLLGFFEVSFSVGARRLIQLVLGPDLINQRATGAGTDKQSQDCCRANPGPRESHSISSV
jgi:hypothetical protein